MKQITFFSIALAISLFVVSCGDDEDDNPSPSSSFPVTLMGMNETPEFRMWTNGQEVNTSNLDPEAYIDIFWPLLDPDNLLISSYTFTMDSLIGQSDTTVTLPYTFRGDSLFVSETAMDGSLVSTYIGIGNFNELITTRGYYSYFEPSTMLIPQIRSRSRFVDIDLVQEMTGQDDIVNSLGAQDTLIIYNMRTIYN